MNRFKVFFYNKLTLIEEWAIIEAPNAFHAGMGAIHELNAAYPLIRIVQITNNN